MAVPDEMSEAQLAGVTHKDSLLNYAMEKEETGKRKLRSNFELHNIYP